MQVQNEYKKKQNFLFMITKKRIIQKTAQDTWNQFKYTWTLGKGIWKSD